MDRPRADSNGLGYQVALVDAEATKSADGDAGLFIETILEGVVPKVTVLDMLAGFALSAGGAIGQDTELTVVGTRGAACGRVLMVCSAVDELVLTDGAVVVQVVVLVTTKIP